MIYKKGDILKSKVRMNLSIQGGGIYSIGHRFQLVEDPLVSEFWVRDYEKDTGTFHFVNQNVDRHFELYKKLLRPKLTIKELLIEEQGEE